MGLLFTDALHDRLGTWPLAYIPYGGADFGEVRGIANEIGDGDDARFYEVWQSAARRFAADASAAEDKQKLTAASALWLRASCFYATSYHPLYGKPLDPRLVEAHALQVDAFDRAMDLRGTHVERLSIPCGDTMLPGYFIHATDDPDEVRPLLILNNGYDATITDLYFAMAAAALQRGYHCVLFDGPGQGSSLIRNNVPMRPDWEVVIQAVVDTAVSLRGVDPARIALYGWSLGGYLAPRAASAEPRLAACIADPGLHSMLGGAEHLALRFGATPEESKRLSHLSDAVLANMMDAFETDRVLRWSVIQRSFWVHGVDNLRDYFRSAETFTMDGRTADIRCPTLLTLAEEDSLAAGSQAFYEALRCPKTLMRFTTAEGAGDHCEMFNRSLVNRRVLDWLDDVFERR